MLKKFTAFFLILVLLASTAVTALAAGDGLKEKLARVTQIVKDTLGIDDRYTQYNGQLTEEGDYSYWELTWSNDTESLNVCADENGKVLRYDRYTDNGGVYDYFYGYAPVLPDTDADDALPIARAFVDKVLGAGETAAWDPYDSGRYSSDVDSYTFSGTIELNGLKSPIYFYVQVQTGDMHVDRFYRSDCYNAFGAVPSASAPVSADKAASLLAGAMELRLVYVLSEDGKTAVLQYLPVYSGDWIVDAKTGELIDLDALYNDIVYARSQASMGMEDSTAEAPLGGSGLSEVEQSAVDALEGVWSKEELDAAVRGMTELGVDGNWTLQSLGYTTDRETGEVFGQLFYTREITDEAVIKARFPDVYSVMKASGDIYPIYFYKNISVDAMTGGLVSIYSYTSAGNKEASKLEASQLGDKAASFLQKYFPDTYAKTAINEPYSDAADGSFVYSQAVNDILFPQNSVLIDVNVYDGTIDSFNISWTDGVSFAPADGIVSADTARAAYLGCFEAVLQYVQVPVETDPYNYTYALKLAYAYESGQDVMGVDAGTGEPIIYDDGGAAEPLVYDDLQGCYGKQQIEALARHGVGFPGASFMPTAKLTQKDALILLLSAVGYSSEDEENLYRVAYDYKLLTSAEREPGKLMTRAQLLKMLIGATEYGPAAELEGIYVCGFNDDARIAAEYYGYVAIAKGLGVIRGDANNNFNPNSVITRQDTAIILYNYMSR